MLDGLPLLGLGAAQGSRTLQQALAYDGICETHLGRNLRGWCWVELSSAKQSKAKQSKAGQRKQSDAKPKQSKRNRGDLPGWNLGGHLWGDPCGKAMQSKAKEEKHGKPNKSKRINSKQTAQTSQTKKSKECKAKQTLSPSGVPKA